MERSVSTLSLSRVKSQAAGDQQAAAQTQKNNMGQSKKTPDTRKVSNRKRDIKIKA